LIIVVIIIIQPAAHAAMQLSDRFSGLQVGLALIDIPALGVS
jgi:hypothetical protein